MQKHTPWFVLALSLGLAPGCVDSLVEAFDAAGTEMVFNVVDGDNDGALTREEWAEWDAWTESQFDEADANGDGILDLDEFSAAEEAGVFDASRAGTEETGFTGAGPGCLEAVCAAEITACEADSVCQPSLDCLKNCDALDVEGCTSPIPSGECYEFPGVYEDEYAFSGSALGLLLACGSEASCFYQLETPAETGDPAGAGCHGGCLAAKCASEVTACMADGSCEEMVECVICCDGGGESCLDRCATPAEETPFADLMSCAASAVECLQPSG